jgi:hypothetical protein
MTNGLSGRSLACILAALTVFPPSGASAASLDQGRKQCIERLRGFASPSGGPSLTERVDALKRKVAAGDKSEATESMLVTLRDLQWTCSKYEGMRECAPGPLDMISLPPKPIRAGESETVSFGNEANGVAFVAEFKVVADGSGLKVSYMGSNRTGDCVITSAKGYRLKPVGVTAGDLPSVGQSGLSFEPGQGFGQATTVKASAAQAFEVEIGDFVAR